MKYLVSEVPKDIPITFKQDIVPSDKLIHKGIFSPDLKEYYYTISDKNFEQFNIYFIKKENDKWSQPTKAFFNSNYNDHGMSFSPDGNSLYFSSTRPVNVDSIPSTWHIWRSKKVNDNWAKPEYIDIPNFRDKLISHPSISKSGNLYFHVSNLDYSNMDIYYSKQLNGQFENAKKLMLSTKLETGKCTPHISPNEDYILFATIGNELDLMISFNDGKGGWRDTRKLNDLINNKGQGNPYVTPDNKFLFYTTGDHSEVNWSVKWINIESELKRD